MNDKELLRKVSKETSLKSLEDIKKLYRKLEKKEKIFCDYFCIHCTKSCGKCCEHFVPEISELEAEYLAYGLIKEEKDQEVLEQLSKIELNSIIKCPLYRDDIHCSVYPFRPLICRLFMASASKDKNGNPTFRNCKYKLNTTHFTDEDLKKHQDKICSMPEYGNLLEDLENGNNQKEPLQIALEKAINKIRYLMEIENSIY